MSRIANCANLQQFLTPSKWDARAVVDLHSDFTVYLEYPKPYIPEKKSRKGRQPTRYRSEAASYEVRKLVEDFELSKQPVLKLRKIARGPLKMRVFAPPRLRAGRRLRPGVSFFSYCYSNPLCSFLGRPLAAIESSRAVRAILSPAPVVNRRRRFRFPMRPRRWI